MRLVFLGDIVGRTGRRIVCEQVATLRTRLDLDAVIVNGENAAGGFGITGEIADELFAAGADVITTGNHVWAQPEVLACLDREPRLLRPVNYPPGAPGRGIGVYPVRGGRLMVVNVMGRIFMEPLDDPFAALDEALTPCPLTAAADAVVVDVHAEATSEKMAMGHFCDGRASLVVGTHTHVPTADGQILPGGTAYQSDAGMCGDYNSVIGMEIDAPLERFTQGRGRGRMRPAQGPATLCGVFVETDPGTGLARRMEPVRFGARLSPAMPQTA